MRLGLPIWILRQNSSRCNGVILLLQVRQRKPFKLCQWGKLWLKCFGMLRASTHWFYGMWYDHHFCCLLWHFEKTKKNNPKYRIGTFNGSVTIMSELVDPSTAVPVDPSSSLLLSSPGVFVYDDTRPHIAQRTNELVAKFKWDVFDYPPFSPDLAPSNFHTDCSKRNVSEVRK